MLLNKTSRGTVQVVQAFAMGRPQHILMVGLCNDTHFNLIQVKLQDGVYAYCDLKVKHAQCWRFWDRKFES